MKTINIEVVLLSDLPDSNLLDDAIFDNFSMEASEYTLVTPSTLLETIDDLEELGEEDYTKIREALASIQEGVLVAIQ